ncbi:ABC transporter permease [Pontibacter sp. MBLB2868]|uniref:ABC transporter permease n=1 Tax=Pontibacter sp. MBLB2868 TaxID=3451555 RepID=UPI003F74F936
MFNNYFKITLRNLYRNKVYSAINIVGLAIGVASCILIFLYVQDELSYENHFSKADRIVRLVGEINSESGHEKFALSPAALAPALLKDFPDTEHITQLARAGKQTVWYQEKSFNEDDLLFADSAFFQVFDYEMLAGNPATALDAPNKVVLSEEMAKRYFSTPSEAVGQVLTFSNEPYQVTGVFRNPGHSHIKANAFISRSTLDARLDNDSRTNQWFALNRFTYVLLHSPQEFSQFQDKMDAFAEKHVNPWIKENKLTGEMRFVVQPLKTIHFDTNYAADLSPAGNISYVYIFAAVAVFLLLIACINYMNLATARSAKRAKEVGLRKVVGAYRSQIILQFLGESLLMTMVAVILALALVQILIPTFNSLTDKVFTSGFFWQWEFLAIMLAIVVFVGVVAGSYPAFFLSHFKPAEVLKSDKSPKGGSATLRKALVVLQFSISLIMIIGTIVVMTQMHFLKNKDLGFNKDQIIVIDIPRGDSALVKGYPRFRQELLSNPNVAMVSNTNDIPADRMSKLLTFIEKDGQMVERTMNVMFTDYDFIDVMGIKLSSGRNYSLDHKTDEKGGIILNEAAVRQMGWSDPIGKRVQLFDIDAKVIGVTKDFHVTSLHSEVEPLALVLTPESDGFVMARIKGQDLAATIGFIENRWQAFDPRHPMDYFFMDEHFDKQYRAEEKMLTIFGYFAGLTILIACLGLFGLASFTAEQRTKEIGIRKVLGSSTGAIVMLLTKDFALLVIVAILLASPVAWYGMHYWLQDFAYRIDLSWWIFVVAGLTAMAIALFTVSFQAIKAAMLDPARAIRTE